MSGIIDYLKWRGDLPFSADPFNEVDGLILSELVYVDYADLPDEMTNVTLEEAYYRYLKKNPAAGMLPDAPGSEKIELLKAAAVEPRFKNSRLCFFVNEHDKELDHHFTALTFLLDDGTAFAAFRGSDHTFVSWKDALDLSYMEETAGQRRAVSYFNSLDRLPDRPLRAGGHSKGGNLAVYGAAFSSPEIQDRILEIYSYDGPGFRDEVIMSGEYRRILPKTISIIPDASVIGRLMQNAAVPRVVRSTAVGLAQHNAFTWCVERNHFAYTDISEFGIFLDRSVEAWTGQMDSKTRESLILSIFKLLEGTGKQSFRELKTEKLKTLEALLTGMNELPEDKRQEVLRMAKQLVESGRDTLRTGISDYLEARKKAQQ